MRIKDSLDLDSGPSKRVARETDRKASMGKIYREVFLLSTIAGFLTFFLISFYFQRGISWKLLISSAVLGPLIGNMIGFASIFIADPIARRTQDLRRPFNRIALAASHFITALGAAAFFFFITAQIGIMPFFQKKTLLVFLLISGGIGLAAALTMTIYEHLKLELARSYEKVKEKELMEKELQLAREVQTGFLPKGKIMIKGFDVASFFRPAKEVGGDYFDVIPLKDGAALAIADVSGKGAPAALVTAGLSATIRALAENCSPKELVAKINGRLLESTTADRFATLFYGILYDQKGELEYVNAGHNPPFLVRVDGAIEELREGGTILGALPNADFRTGSAVIFPGDLLLLYTDGLTEAGLPDIEPWGEENLKKHLIGIRDCSAEQGVKFILDQMENALVGIPQTDDIAMIILKRNSAQ
jgi:serine phosphatase RsbU (regulator of sigma subunit)